MNTNDFRKPTDKEREIINKYILLKTEDTIKVCKIATFIFIPLNLSMIIEIFKILIYSHCFW